MRHNAVLTAVDELVPGGADAELRILVSELDVLAVWKYDRYEGYGPGQRFWEHAIAWLRRLDAAERADALRMLRRELVFVTRAELAHLVGCAYADHLKPALLRRMARERGLEAPPFAPLARTPEFDDLLRGIVVVGLSDGARLDLLRRATPELTESQFVLDHRAEVPDGASHVVAVDDFSGTGGSLVRREGQGFAGRLAGLGRRLPGRMPGSVLLYIASARAARHLRSTMGDALPGWDVVIVQELRDSAAANARAVRRMHRRHYGAEPAPERKGGRNAGYREGDLSLVLDHNTPNDSLALLWAPPDGGPWYATALFPRRERLTGAGDER
jgi:hypothetical protein